MTITLTKDFSRVTFNWSEDLESCSFVSLNVDDDIVDAMIQGDAHEGVSFKGWTTVTN